MLDFINSKEFIEGSIPVLMSAFVAALLFLTLGKAGYERRKEKEAKL